MTLLDAAGRLLIHAFMGLVLGTALEGVARLAALALLWGNPFDLHGWLMRQVAYGAAAAAILATGHALATAAVGGGSRRPPLRFIAGALGTAAALALVHAFIGRPGQTDLDLPVSRVIPALVFGGVVSAAVGAGPMRCGPRAARGALAGGIGLVALQIAYGADPGGVPALSDLPGGLEARLLAGLAEGIALGAALGLALPPHVFVPPVLLTASARLVAVAVLAVALATGVTWIGARRLVADRSAALEAWVARVRAHPRMADPLFARWLSDVRTRQEKAADGVRRLPWYLLRMHGPFHHPWPPDGPLADLGRVFDDAELLCAALLSVPPPAGARASARHLLKLVEGFRVPAALEWQEHFRRNVLVVFRGGVPLFTVAATRAGEPDHQRYLDAASGPSARTEVRDGLTLVRFLHYKKPLIRIGEWIYEVQAPTEELRGRVAVRLALARPLAPGDDLADDTAPVPADAAAATARGWLAAGLRPYFGDVHTHDSGSLGGTAPGPTSSANALSQFMHFQVLTEHFSAGTAAPLARFVAEHAPGCALIPGEEIVLGRAHLTALGLATWIPAPWWTYGAPPEDYLARIRSTGAVAVLAHARYPDHAWQTTALRDWRRLGIAAVEATRWLPDGETEAMSDPPPLLSGSDAHCGCFGGSNRTMLLARDGSPEALLDAIREGRCLALSLEQPLWSRGSPAMRAALRLLMAEPGRLERELAATWRGHTVGLRP